MNNKKDLAAVREALKIRARAAMISHLRRYREVRFGTPCEKIEDHSTLRHVFRFEDLARLADVARLDEDRLVYTGPPAPVPVVFVGEDNPHNTQPFFDLYDDPPGSAGWRLRTKILGISREVYFGPDVYRADLCRGKWSAPAARQEAERLKHTHPRAVFVLLGRKVRDAFAYFPTYAAQAETFEVFDGSAITGRRRVVLLPHPSGRCRYWSEPDAVEKVQGVLSAAGLGWLLGETTDFGALEGL